MILEKGDMWSVFGKTDWFVITTNPIRREDGAVVMGRGIALEAKTRFPSLPYDFGKMLENVKKAHPNHTPIVRIIGKYDGQNIMCFMTKHHWHKPADISLIKEGVRQLAGMASGVKDRFDLNFPGIGNGKLKREDVLTLLQKLPDNVHIWEKE